MHETAESLPMVIQATRICKKLKLLIHRNADLKYLYIALYLKDAWCLLYAILLVPACSNTDDSMYIICTLQ